MSNPTSDDDSQVTDSDAQEAMFTLSDDEYESDSDRSGACEDGEGMKGEETADGADGWWAEHDNVPELQPVSTIMSKSPEDYIVYGTTPPHSGRLEKTASKSHKYKTSRKMFPGPTAIKHKTEHKSHKTDSTKAVKTRAVFPKSPQRKQNSKVTSPGHSSGDSDQKTKRQRKQLRKQERDSKSSLFEVSLPTSPKIVHDTPPSVNVVDYTPSSSATLTVSASGSEFDGDVLTSSLQPSQLSSWRESTNSLRVEFSKPRRIQSDFSLTSQPSDERQFCPPERKKFFRNYVNTLKHSNISQMTRPHSESTQLGTVYHMARMRSENLAMENPFGDVWERIWLELKAYLSDQAPDTYEEWLFFKSNHIEQVLRDVIDFRMEAIDPVLSLNSAFFGVEDEDSEVSRSKSGHSEGSSKQVSFSLDIGHEGQDEPDQGSEHSTDGAQKQESLSSEDSETVQYETRQFLSQPQLAAVHKVNDLLQDLEEIERLFPNRRKMGDEYSNYRTIHFRRRVSALVLWHKVTCGLASKLASLSMWLGVQVEHKEVCDEPTPSYTCDQPPPPLPDDGEIEHSGILVTSPKSLSDRKTRFKCASQSSDDDAVLTHQASMGRSTNSTATLQRLFSNYQLVLENQGAYREFVNKSLKKKGLNNFMKALLQYIKPALTLAQYALCPPNEPAEEEKSEQHLKPVLQHFMNPDLFKSTPKPEELTPQFERTTSTGPENWIQEFEQMGLPLFTMQYIQLVHVPLDVMHECVRLQLELRPSAKPSSHSVRQLVRECRDTLEQAIEIRKFYRERMELITRNKPSKSAQVEADIEAFESDLKFLLEVYFNYLTSWVQVSSGHILEEEWRHVKKICAQIRGGEAEAGQRFCDMASHLLESTGDVLGTRMDECCRILHRAGDHPEQRRAAIADSCRSFKELFVDVRERASKALGFAKMLRKDLEIAADFNILTSTPQLLQALQASDHVQVKLPNTKLDKMLFVTEPTSNAPDEINELLNVSFTLGTPTKAPTFGPREAYLLLVNLDVASSQSSWNGRTMDTATSAETISAISEIQVESLKMIACESGNLSDCRNSFLNAVGTAVRLVNEQTSSHENVAERLSDLKMAACVLGSSLMDIALQVMEHLGIEDTPTGDDLSKHYQATMHSCFNLGFEYVREVFRLLGDDMAYSHLGEKALNYATLWMRFVLDKCDRGRGTRPRWASTGLEFMTIACAPRTLATISQTKFEALRKLVDRCVDHIVGEAPTIRKDQPVRSAVRHSRLKRSPRLTDRAHSETIMLKSIPDEDDELLKPPFHPQMGLCPSVGGGLAVDVEQGIIRVQASKGVNRGDDLGPGLRQAIPMPNSTESIDSIEQHSSGVDSPLHMSGELATLPSGYNPMVTPQRGPDLDRMDSSVSVSRFYSSTLTLTRRDSSPALRTSERVKRIQSRVKSIDMDREERLRMDRVIGRVKPRQSSSHSDAKLGDIMVSHFKWQRGRKLGEGRFGKVYECLNLTSGEINAVKQISIQEKDSSTVQTILDEISVFQRLNHPNIVKFYGVEIHHTDLYMFMEYCNEGTLWSIAQQGLTEEMIRHYTRDILRAVYFLHDQGIVHRDIKGCNIFLSSNGSIKLGDFGLSVQLKNYHKTMPNEIKQQVGTVPYMSPEVILNRSMGRPMDIWSIGCVVVEMATGKLPWSECENQFQIMYQLGSGETPRVHPPDALSDEGHDFLKRCFIAKPEERLRAIDLLDHPFVKVDDTEDD